MPATAPHPKYEYYAELAREYQKEHECRWSEATLAIKKKHPEAREAFGAPPKLDDERR